MSQDNSERRQFRRILFEYEDNITANVSSDGKEFTCIVLNLSARGMYVSADAIEIENLQSGMSVHLSEISTPQETIADLDIDSEVKWVLGSATMNYPGFGCEFKIETAAGLDKLESFLNKFPANR